MSDRGAKHADKRIAQIDRELRKTYREAQRELAKKLADFNRRFAAQDKKKRQEVRDGKISESEYKDWLRRQVFTQQTWERKIAQVESVMLHHNEHAMQIINDSKFDVFAENYYSEAFKANWIVQGINWEVYNTQALMRLLKDDPDLLPKWKIDQKKDYDWNQQKVNNILRQGIIQGESVDQLTERLCRDLSSQNKSKMRMFARTAITGAQNAGRQVQMEQAAQLGLQVNKKWLAVLDSRTRDSHRGMDGEEVPYNENFSNGLEYPGDPSGSAEEVYNCRCTMITVYPEYEDRTKQWREGETIDGQPYEEWKEEAKQRLEEKETKREVAAQKSSIDKAREIVTAHGNKPYTTDELIELGKVVNDAVNEETPKYDLEKLHKEWRELSDKYHDLSSERANLKMKSIVERNHGNIEEYERLSRQIDELDKKRVEISAKSSAAYYAYKDAQNAHGTALKNIMPKLRETATVTKDNIGQYAQAKGVKAETKASFAEAMRLYPKAWLDASKAYIRPLSKTEMPLVLRSTTGRAHYEPSTGLIYTDGDLGTSVHELAHRFEQAISNILRAEEEFYKRRTDGEALEWLGSGYSKGEKTRRDHFVDSYMGKDYGGSAYELASMGIETAFTDYDRLKKGDEEMLYWILGMLAGI